MAHSFNEIVQHHDHYIDSYNKTDKKKHLPLDNLSTKMTKCAKNKICIATFEKRSVCHQEKTSVCELGETGWPQASIQTLIVLYQTKSPNVQCHKDLKIQWDTTSLNVPEQSNKLFKRTCWNGETMLIHERFCPTCSESVKANEMIFCVVNS